MKSCDGKRGWMEPHSVIRRTVEGNFMRNFWDREGTLDFCSVASCTGPIQCNLAVVDSDQSEQTGYFCVLG